MAKVYDILDAAEVIEALSDSEAGILLKALCHIKAGGEVPPVPRAVKVVLNLELPKMREAEDHRRQVSEKCKNSVKKRWEKRDTNVYERTENDTNVYERIRTYNSPPLSTPIINTPSQYPKGYSDAPKGAALKKKVFVVPSIDEIVEFCQEKGLAFDAEDFFDFYQSKNWMVGKNKMSDWRAAARRWAKSQQVQRSAYSQPVQERMKL